jgi:hypothetical protein
LADFDSSAFFSTIEEALDVELLESDPPQAARRAAAAAVPAVAASARRLSMRWLRMRLQ